MWHVVSLTLFIFENNTGTVSNTMIIIFNHINMEVMKINLKRLLMIIMSFVLTSNFANGQGGIGFGDDIIAHDDINYNDEISDLAVAFNGWIYLATSSRHVNPSGADIVISMSKDSGLSWTELSNTSGAHNNISYVDIMVTGSDTNSLRVYIAQIGNDIGNLNGTGSVVVFNGLTGRFIQNSINLYNLSFNADRGISMSSDYLHPSLGTIGYSVAIIFQSSDSLICLIAPDTGSITYNTYLIDTGFISEFSIGYGYSPSNGGKYYIAYTRMSNSGGTQMNVCKNISNVTSGFTQPLPVTPLSGGSFGLSSAKILCQNSNTNNDSMGLSVAMMTLSNNGRLQVIYNMQAAISNYWFAASVDDSAGLGLSGEYDTYFSPENNLLYACGFDDRSGKLWARAENFNFENSNHWINLSDQYNDTLIDISITNYLHPHPKVSALGSRFISSWSSTRPIIYPYPGGYPHRMRTLIDKSDSIVVTNVRINLKKNLFKLYPVPADDYISIDIPSYLENKTISIEITEVGGKELFNKSIMYIRNIKLDTSNIKDGIYLLKIFSNDYYETQKILICHSDLNH